MQLFASSLPRAALLSLSLGLGLGAAAMPAAQPQAAMQALAPVHMQLRSRAGTASPNSSGAGAGSEAAVLELSGTAPSRVQNGSFASWSIEPAYWSEFIGTSEAPNELVHGLLSLLTARGAAPNIRPGGITMDSMVFNASQIADLVRDTDPSTGAVYRTTVSPGFYRSWGTLPDGIKVVTTLNFGNQSYAIARDLALAAFEHAPAKRLFTLELGNEANNYWNTSGANGGAAGYVREWKNWTQGINAAVDDYLARAGRAPNSKRRWWASSSTTDQSAVILTPAAIIPLGIDADEDIDQYSIHSYPYSTCDPARTKLATIPNILNVSAFYEYADTQILPSGKAAEAEGQEWIIGEYNSVSCSGRVNVTDTYAQALWALVTQLGYASLNASATYLHQGGTLALQSSDQANNASTRDGKPSFSAYDLVFPVDTDARGAARANPAFLAQLVVAEALAGANGSGTRVSALDTPHGVDPDYFAAFALYDEDAQGSGKKEHGREEHKGPSRVLLVNSKPFYAGNSTADSSVELDISALTRGHGRTHALYAKRLSAPSVDEKDSAACTWAGQSFRSAAPQRMLDIERIDLQHGRPTVSLRDSEALLLWIEGAPFDA